MNPQGLGSFEFVKATNIPLSINKNIRTGVNINLTIGALLSLVHYFNVAVEDILTR